MTMNLFKEILSSLMQNASHIKECIPRKMKEKVEVEVELRMKVSEKVFSSLTPIADHLDSSLLPLRPSQPNVLGMGADHGCLSEQIAYNIYKKYGMNVSLRVFDNKSVISKEKIWSDKIMHNTKLSMSIERQLCANFPKEGLLYKGRRKMEREEIVFDGFKIHKSKTMFFKPGTEEEQPEEEREVEIEIISSEADYNHIALIVAQINMPKGEHKKILKKCFIDYSHRVFMNIKKNKFRKPVSMTIRDVLYSFSKTKYAVTNKTDGERVFLITSPFGLFEVNSRRKVVLISHFSGTDVVILDCEKKEGHGSHEYIVFDCYMRDREESLEERMKKAEKLCIEMSPFFRYGIKIKAKKHFLFDTYEEMIHHIDKKLRVFSQQEEGLIFTPVDDLFAPIYKWKKVNTIDFQTNFSGLLAAPKGARREHSETTTGLLASVVVGEHSKATTGRTTLFVGKNKDSGFHLTGSFIIENPTIVECSVNLKTKEATLMRIRKDRHAPNSMETFCSVIESIKQKEKIESCLLRKGVYLMRALHNDLKSKVLSKYKGRLLDVGSGRGGDIKKWKHFEKIVCVDPNLTIFKERLSTCNYKNKIEMHEMNISEFSSSNPTLPLSGRPLERYTLMSCFFCLNIFSDDEIDALVDQSDKCDSIVIIAMDMIEGKIEPIATKQFSLIPLPQENAYSIDIPGTYVHKVKERNNLSLIISRLKKKGFYVKENERLTMEFMKTFFSLKTDPFLSEEEKFLSSLFRFVSLSTNM